MRILLVHDLDGWSFHNISQNIQRVAAKAAPGCFEFRVLSRKQWVCQPHVLWEALEWSQVHIFFWRFDLIAAIDILNSSNANRKKLVEMLSERVTITVVYDHLYLEEKALTEMGDPFEIGDIHCVSSPTLQKIYTDLPHLPNPKYVLIDGVDTSLFVPVTTPTITSDTTKPLRIGWVGNSLWGSNIGQDMKGFRTIFQPAIDKIRADGTEVIVHVADREITPVPKEKMPDFYQNLDLYVCTSYIEGTPNPVLEAMVAGVAVVSTDVGVVRDVLGSQQRQMIVERDPVSFFNAFSKLDQDRSLLNELKAENIKRRDILSWEARFESWSNIFDEAESILGSKKRQQRKAEVLTSALNRNRSALAQVRRVVFSNTTLYRLYNAMLNRHPKLMRLLRSAFKH